MKAIAKQSNSLKDRLDCCAESLALDHVATIDRMATIEIKLMPPISASRSKQDPHSIWHLGSAVLMRGAESGILDGPKVLYVEL